MLDPALDKSQKFRMIVAVTIATVRGANCCVVYLLKKASSRLISRVTMIGTVATNT